MGDPLNLQLLSFDFNTLRSPETKGKIAKSEHSSLGKQDIDIEIKWMLLLSKLLKQD